MHFAHNKKERMLIMLLLSEHPSFHPNFWTDYLRLLPVGYMATATACYG